MANRFSSPVAAPATLAQAILATTVRAREIAHQAIGPMPETGLRKAAIDPVQEIDLRKAAIGPVRETDRQAVATVRPQAHRNATAP